MFCFIFEPVAPSVAPADLEHVVSLLSQPPKCWEYRCEPLSQATIKFSQVSLDYNREKTAVCLLSFDQNILGTRFSLFCLYLKDGLKTIAGLASSF